MGEVLEALGFDKSKGGGLLSPHPRKSSLTCRLSGRHGFSHVLNERLVGSSMVEGIVLASPALLRTSFFDADLGEIKRDDTLQARLNKVLAGNNDYSREIEKKNLAVAVVDLSGNKLAPRYAGVHDTTNFYAGSVAKVCGVLAAYQLVADVNAFLRDNPHITSLEEFEKAVKGCWSSRYHPKFGRILQFYVGKRKDSPSTVDLRQEVRILFNVLNTNANASAPIVLLGFPYIGSTMLAHGLFSPAHGGGGLWLSKDYGPSILGGQLGRWRSGNLYPSVPLHCVNAVSMAQFFTLAAQNRMIDGTTSKAILGHLDHGCYSHSVEVDVSQLRATGRICAKCGIWDDPEDPKTDVVHDAIYYEEALPDGKSTASLFQKRREFVVVILTNLDKAGISGSLFRDLVHNVLGRTALDDMKDLIKSTLSEVDVRDLIRRVAAEK